MTEKMTATIEPRAAAILTGLLHCESCEITEDGGARWRMSHGITIEMHVDPVRWHVGVTPPAKNMTAPSSAGIYPQPLAALPSNAC